MASASHAFAPPWEALRHLDQRLCFCDVQPTFTDERVDTGSSLFSLYFKECIDNSACLTYFICTKTLAMLPFFVSLLLPHYRELPNRSPQMSPQLASQVFFATVFAANFNCRLVKLLLSGKGPSAYPKNTNKFFLENSESSS